MRKQLKDHEQRIEIIQKKIARIDLGLSDETLYAKEPAKALSMTQERSGLAKELKIAEDAWLETSLVYEEAAGGG